MKISEIKTIQHIFDYCVNASSRSCRKCALHYLKISCRDDVNYECWAKANGPKTLSNIFAHIRKEKLKKLLS